MARRQLRLRLRRARTDAGMSQAEVAERLDWSTSKVLRVENGQSTVQVVDVIAMVSLFPALADERADLEALARQARRPTVASRSADVHAPLFREWLDYEASANKIKQFEALFVPGVLQLDEYAIPLVTELSGDANRAERIAELRNERAEQLLGDGGPAMEFIIDEVVLRRAVDASDAESGFRTMVSQLEHLKKVNTVGRLASGEEIEPDLNRDISVQIVPFSRGPYRIMQQPFELLEFQGDDEPYMMYFENPRGDQFIRDRYDDIADFVDRFSALKKILPGPEVTNSQIDNAIRLMNDGQNSVFS